MVESVITNGQQEKQTDKEKLKPSRKLGGSRRCLSRLTVTIHASKEVEVKYLPLHTNHTLDIEEQAKNLPLPVSVKQSIVEKLEAGIPVPRVLQGKCDCQF